MATNYYNLKHEKAIFTLMQKNSEKGRLAIIKISEMTVNNTAQRAVSSTISAETRYASLDN